MLNSKNYTAENGFVSDDALLEMVEGVNSNAGAAKEITKRLTTTPCWVAGGITAASAYLDDACPTRACTSAC